MNNKKVLRDASGFISDSAMWSEDFAISVAMEFNLDMNDKHWEIIRLIRSLHDESQIVPELRTVLKYLKINNTDKIVDRKYIYNLFPYGYGQQACMIAGMREPKKLWLDL